MDSIREMGRRIAQRRTRLSLTQDSLARVVGVAPHTVSRWERGAAMPEAEHLMGLAAALGCTVEFLLRGHASKVTRKVAAGEVR